MDTFAIVKPGDKAIIYLNSYSMNFSRETPWDKSEGDFLWLPENSGYKIKDGVVPEGLRIRTNEEMVNIGSQAILEVQKGGYELLDTVFAPIDNPEFENTLLRLDSGEAQMLVTYASMLPASLVENGLPTEFFFCRARRNGWRICLISLNADPFSNSMFFKSEYIHFGKEENYEGVIVMVTDRSLEMYLNKDKEPPKRKPWFRK